MPHYAAQEDLLSSSSHFLSPTKQIPHRSSRQNINSRRSSASLRSSSSLAHAINNAADDNDDGSAALNGSTNGGNRQHSLAHELAFALMPEPSAGSKLLAEEFGIEYDEGAEGIDEPVNTGRRASHQYEGADFGKDQDQELLDDAQQHALLNGVSINLEHNEDVGGDGGPGFSFADELNGVNDESSHDTPPGIDGEFGPGEYEINGVGSPSPRKRPVVKVQRPEVDPMEVLAQDLESTETFLKHLRTLDSDGTAKSSPKLPSSLHPSQQPALERYASDIIRKMNEAARDREGQLRELLEYDKEFKKIAGEVGGTEALSRVDELPPLDEENNEGDQNLASSKTLALLTPTTPTERTLDTVAEEDHTENHDWDIDPHAHLNNELGDDISPSTSISPSPTKAGFSHIPPPLPIPSSAKATPASAIPHFTDLRTFTSSLITSLTTLSEQAQVNGAASTEAGRKIKALKNKMGGWQVEWESAEKSRIRIERWEAGIVEGPLADGEDPVPMGTVSPSRLAARRRVDGRKLVEEHLAASGKAIREATEMTQAIMAR